MHNIIKLEQSTLQHQLHQLQPERDDCSEQQDLPSGEAAVNQTYAKITFHQDAGRQ